MIRVMATDVVNAYKQTGLIPIRRAWQTSDTRGGCAIDALSRSLGDENGEVWSTRLDPDYLRGFLACWDDDDPMLDAESGDEQTQGFWDAITCRQAVTEAFASPTPVEINSDPTS